VLQKAAVEAKRRAVGGRGRGDVVPGGFLILRSGERPHFREREHGISIGTSVILLVV